jgi:ligand-binding SRPBCC domain-containing protein
MPFIHLTTFIAAPRERVFDLSRNVSVHKVSMRKYGESLVHSGSNALMELNDMVQWQAKHLFRNRKLKVKMSAMNAPLFFRDEQVDGDFKMMKHEHYFKAVDNGTIMIDQFWFESPYGIFGKIFNRFFLVNYMKQLLSERNAFIKKIAEGNQWKQY